MVIKFLKPVAVGLVAATLAFPLGSAAQQGAAWKPTKPVRVIVPFPPGGSNDIVGRIVANDLSPLLGQQVVIDNRGGAGGIIGTEIAANSLPDGHTLLIASVAFAYNPSIYKAQVRFDPEKSFTPIALIGTGPSALTVSPKMPAKSTKELIDMAKAKPGSMTYATAGIGTSNHLIGAYMNKELGLDISHVPYRSGGLATGAAVAGEVPIVIDQISTVLPFLTSGKLRAIAVTSPKRSQLLPDVPSITESVLPSIKFDSYQALFAPAGLPPELVRKLNDTVRTALSDPEIRKRHLELGIELVLNSSGEFTAWLRETSPRWQELVALSGAKVE